MPEVDNRAGSALKLDGGDAVLVGLLGFGGGNLPVLVLVPTVLILVRVM